MKFGGASVKDATAVKNMAAILKGYPAENLLVVVSAMGKMTNQFEALLQAKISGKDLDLCWQKIMDYHSGIVRELFPADPDKINEILGAHFKDIQFILRQDSPEDPAFAYDQLVSFGELLSSQIIEAYLKKEDFRVELFDARNIIITDNHHKEGRVDWEKSQRSGKVLKEHISVDDPGIILTQGFIARSYLGNTTTLGREGSDFSAAIFAYLLDADEVIFWKDVPGMLNADPKWFNNTVTLKSISFREAVELSYYGASVIHPKTIKPLQNKGIPIYIRSFVNPQLAGTSIVSSTEKDDLIPSYIFKANQMLISVSPRDFSFIVEENLSSIFSVLSELDMHINLMQNSAISFSFCVDADPSKFNQLYALLSREYKVVYNDQLELLTVRHYAEDILKSLTAGKEILLEQRSRHTARFALRG